MESTEPRGRAKRDSDITAIILAAGANVRLNGIVPAFLKSLILANGRPLVLHATDHAILEWEAERVILVVSPDNAKLLTQVVQSDPAIDNFVRWVLQPHPYGVVDAVHRGVELVKTTWTLILCADNTFSPLHETRPVYDRPPRYPCFGSRELEPTAARRFTRYMHRDAISGVRLLEPNDPEESGKVWIGPLLLETKEVRDALYARACYPKTIVELINQATDGGRRLTPLPMTCEDLGVPEAL